jgi:hypothetical protein
MLEMGRVGIFRRAIDDPAIVLHCVQGWANHRPNHVMGRNEMDMALIVAESPGRLIGDIEILASLT